MEKKESIIINNASTNNLKNITVSIPLEASTCVIGVSGCGKSSLVYDTLFAESQRNFLESMSGNMYGQKLMDKPKVDSIDNLRPALNVAQSYFNHNPRSTVGTLTDMSHYLRALFALIVNYESKSDFGENYFSSNNPSSCCKKCYGLGEEYKISEELLIPDEEKTLKSGAILWYKGKDTSQEHRLLVAICEKYGIEINSKYSELTATQINYLLYREEKEQFLIKFKTSKGRYKQKAVSSKGVVRELEDKLDDIDTPSTFALISKYLIKKECSKCCGTKLKRDVLEKRVCKLNIAEVERYKISDLFSWLNAVEEQYINSIIVNPVLQLTFQIKKRANAINDLKIGYVSLERSIPTLSGGEIQRIRLANQLNCSLNGLIYILDEPCKGLHLKDVDSIINATQKLVENRNTVVSIEHNKQYISAAENIIQLGPEGGPNGGYIISQYKPYSKLKYNISFGEERVFKKKVKLVGINYRNIKKQSIEFPVGGITCVTGVSGSGKSTLVSVIEQCFEKKKNVYCDQADGLSYLEKVLKVNQQPIGKTPRSTVISYLEIYDLIRESFANTEASKNLQLTASDFSMNVSGGRCECCHGTGFKRIELTYLPDSYVMCPECQGMRFKQEILTVKYKNHTINDILDKPISEIIELFKNNIVVYEKLRCMIKIGLGYIKLGQMSMNLSGGEAQRIKLARALGTKKSGKSLFILDEPTSGLNEKDIEKFEKIISELRDNGDTLLIIEHNIEFIVKDADFIIDFGNKAGDVGGIIEAMGTPREVFDNKNSSWYGIISDYINSEPPEIGSWQSLSSHSER